VTKKTPVKLKSAAKPVRTKPEPVKQTAKAKAQPARAAALKKNSARPRIEPKKPEVRKAPVKVHVEPKTAAKAAAKPAPLKEIPKSAAKAPETKTVKSEPVKPAAKPASATVTELKPKAGAAKVDPRALLQKNGAPQPQEGAPPGTPPKDDPDAPLLDMSDAAVRKMVTRAKQRGYVTYDELNRVLPSDKVSSEQIEDTMSMLSEMGINVIESEEQEEADGEQVPAVAAGRAVA